MVPAVLGQLKNLVMQAPSLRQLSAQFAKLLGNNPLTSLGAGLAMSGIAWSGCRHYSFSHGKRVEKEGTALVGRNGEDEDGAVGDLFVAFAESPGGHNLVPEARPTANALAHVLADLKQHSTLGDERLATLARGLEQVHSAKLLRIEATPLRNAWAAMQQADADYQSALSERLEEVRGWVDADATAFGDLAGRLDECDNFETLRAELQAYLDDTGDLTGRSRIGASFTRARRTVDTLIQGIDAQMPALNARAVRRVEALRDAISLSRDHVNESKAKAFEKTKRWGRSTEGKVEAQKISESVVRVMLPAMLGLSALAAALAVRLGGHLKGLNVRWLR